MDAGDGGIAGTDPALRVSRLAREVESDGEPVRPGSAKALETMRAS